MIFSIGVLLISCSLLLSMTLPTESDDSSTKVTDLSQDQELSYSVSKRGLFKKSYIFALITSSWSFFLYDTHLPVLAMRLQNGFGLSQESIGLFFTILPTVYLISTILFGTLIPVGVYTNRTLMITGLYLMFLANLCIGPSFYMGFPDSLLIMAAGQAFLGLFYPLVQCYGMVEMNRLTVLWHPELDSNELASLYDFNSGLFCSFQCAGGALGSLYGVHVTEMVGFRKCIDYVAFGSLALGFLYQVTTRT